VLRADDVQDGARMRSFSIVRLRSPVLLLSDRTVAKHYD
jgi:hypothetical protein